MNSALKYEGNEVDQFWEYISFDCIIFLPLHHCKIATIAAIFKNSEKKLKKNHEE